MSIFLIAKFKYICTIRTDDRYNFHLEVITNSFRIKTLLLCNEFENAAEVFNRYCHNKVDASYFTYGESIEALRLNIYLDNIQVAKELNKFNKQVLECVNTMEVSDRNDVETFFLPFYSPISFYLLITKYRFDSYPPTRAAAFKNILITLHECSEYKGKIEVVPGILWGDYSIDRSNSYACLTEIKKVSAYGVHFDIFTDEIYS